MGRVINHGTIGAATPVAGDTVMKIAGRLESDGNLQFTANGVHQGTIQVTGAVAADGSTLTIDPKGSYLPEYSYGPAVLQNGAAAAIQYKEAAYTTGLMSASLVDGRVAFRVDDHLQGLDALQSRSRAALQNMSSSLGTEQKQTVAPLYNLGENAVGPALTDMAGTDNALVPDVIQQSTLVGRTVSSRLTQALASVQVPAGVGSSLTDGAGGVTVDLPMSK